MKTVELSFKHRGTNRRATVQRVQNYETPLSVAAGKYVLVIAADGLVPLSVKSARAWVDAGASYICAWGPGSPEVEETFDYASFLPEYGQPVPFTLMTTSHRDERLDEALRFAFYNAHAPDDREMEDLGSPIVVIVDSDSIFKSCSDWIAGNVE